MEKNKENRKVGPKHIPKELKVSVGAKLKTENERLRERAKIAGVVGYENMKRRELLSALDRIKQAGGIVPDLRSGNHGKVSPNRDPRIVEIKRAHMCEEIDVTTVNKQTGITKVEKKETLIAMLDMLRHKALKDKDVIAAREYLDRTLGKSRQEIELETINTDEQELPTKAERAAKRAYEKSIMSEEEDDNG